MIEKGIMLAGGKGTRLTEETTLKPNTWLRSVVNQFSGIL